MNKKKLSKKTSSKIDKKSVKMVNPKGILITMIVFFIFLIVLIFRLANLQFVQGSELKEKANRQQTTNRTINAKRGNIYDSTGKLLAASAKVDTVNVNPSYIKEENKEKIAKALSDIFELDYNEVLTKVNNNNSPSETIIKKVEQDKIDELKAWMKENNTYSGIDIVDDVKRYYPYGNLASNLIGFCNTDNVGQEGIELKWDSILTGTSGRILSITNVNSQLIPDENENYIAAENGSDLTLTIDANIQTIAEKYLKQACIENKCE